jgi:lysozyme family protein
MKTVDQMIADIIEREGGYNDIPDDKGGATNEGISLRYLKGVGLNRGDLDHDGDIDKDDVRMVTPFVAADLYREDFFTGPHIDRLPPELQPVMFDMAVNLGPPRAIMLLQGTLRGLLVVVLKDDGVLGPQTRVFAEQALAKFGFKAVQNAVVTSRKEFYDQIVARDPSQQKFLAGWKRRADEFKV